MRRSAFALLPMVSAVSCGSPGEITVQNIWARDTVGRTANAAVFMKIESDVADQLIGADAPVAKKTDLMTFEGGNGLMRMRYLKAMKIPANKSVSLDPRGLHVWLTDLEEPLRQGQTFPLTLRFGHSGERRVMVKVIGPSAAAPISEM